MDGDSTVGLGACNGWMDIGLLDFWTKRCGGSIQQIWEWHARFGLSSSCDYS